MILHVHEGKSLVQLAKEMYNSYCSHCVLIAIDDMNCGSRDHLMSIVIVFMTPNPLLTIRECDKNCI